jgi:hypothetical protein
MRFLPCVVPFLLVLTTGCSINTKSTALLTAGKPDPREAQALGGELVYFVGDSRLDGEGMLEGVDVWMVDKSGDLRQLGETNSLGSIRLSKAELASGLVIGFSREWYFDGAWRVDVQKLQDFDELFITLAPFSLR